MDREEEGVKTSFDSVGSDRGPEDKPRWKPCSVQIEIEAVDQGNAERAAVSPPDYFLSVLPLALARSLPLSLSRDN